MAATVSTFESTEPLLSDLLGAIGRGSIQLPDFQRPWVWDDIHIRSLLASVSQSYPIGAVMLLQTGGDSVRFLPRLVHGVELEGGVEPDRLILDGQQRLTSLYGALFAEGPVDTKNEKQQALKRYYYLDIAACLDPHVDRFDAVRSIPAERVVTTDFGRQVVLDVRTPELEYEHGLFPAAKLLRATGFTTWQMEYTKHHGLNQERWEAIARFQNEVWMRFQQFKVPVIQLLKDTPKEAVCQVFEKVNTGGVSLTVFELVTATFAAGDFSLRVDWEGAEAGDGGERREGRKERLHAHSVLRSIGGTDFLQAVTLLASYRAHQASEGKVPVGVKRRDVLRLELDDYRTCAPLVEEGFLRAARFLNQQAIFDRVNLPYTTQLVPLGAICALLGKRFETVAAKQKLARWYWSGVFGEMYGGANESRYAQDVVDLARWILEDGEEPRTVRDATFDPRRLLTMQTRQSAAYKGVMALLVQRGSHDFKTGDAIALTDGFAIPVDIHHVFPRAWAQKQGLSRQHWNSVVNKSPLTAATNKELRGDAPSKYLARIEAAGAVSAEDLDHILTTHYVHPPLLRADDFSGFLLDRAKRLLDSIAAAMGKPVEGRDAEGVVEDFGGPLTWSAAELEAEQPKVVLYDRYEVLHELTSGGMSHVSHARDRESGREVCVKRVPVDGPDADALLREMQIYDRLTRVEFAHCLEVLDVARDEYSIALVTEWAPGGSLEEYVEGQPTGRLDTTETHAIARTLVEAVAELHALDVVHRDLKPSNLLCSGEAWKLADFGIAKNTQRVLTRATMQRVFTPGYAPPEQVEGVAAHPSADIYAIGKIVTFMLTGETDPDRVAYPLWGAFVHACAATDREARPDLARVRSWLDELPR